MLSQVARIFIGEKVVVFLSESLFPNALRLILVGFTFDVPSIRSAVWRFLTKSRSAFFQDWLLQTSVRAVKYVTQLPFGGELRTLSAPNAMRV